MQLIRVVNKDAVREVASNGWLPVHTDEGRLPVHIAARSSTVEVMEFLLSLYPESASVVTTDFSTNLLRLAAYDAWWDNCPVIEAKVRFLCSRYPAMMLQRNGDGETTLQDAIRKHLFPEVQLLCETGGTVLASAPSAHPTDANYKYNGWLALHHLIARHSYCLREFCRSKAASFFRILLRFYPEAGGIEGGIDIDVLPFYKTTPYQMAVNAALPPYYLRLLLRGAPNLNPAEFRRLNYAERRMALFLAFKAVTSQKKPVLLKRLCFDNKDLVKLVISFL